MALSNRERQALYRQRIRTNIEVLLDGYREMISDMETQVELMESGKRGGPGFTTHDGTRNTTDESIAATQERIARLRAVIDQHAPN